MNHSSYWMVGIKCITVSGSIGFVSCPLKLHLSRTFSFALWTCDWMFDLCLTSVLKVKYNTNGNIFAWFELAYSSRKPYLLFIFRLILLSSSKIVNMKRKERRGVVKTRHLSTWPRNCWVICIDQLSSTLPQIGVVVLNLMCISVNCQNTRIETK